VTFAVSSRADGDAIVPPLVIPRPAKVIWGEGSWMLDRMGLLTGNSPEAVATAELFRDALAQFTGRSVSGPGLSASPEGPGIRAELGEPTVGHDESYRLRVTEAGALVQARSAQGLYYGLMSLVQLIGTARERLPAMEVDDAPRFGWRGLCFDVARFFVPPAEVKRVIDVMSLYKLNRLHLHLTDNQGWRLHVPSWPLLTKASAPAGPGSGFYTSTEYRDLAAYAQQRFVTVVPEVDLPGHAGAALLAYPDLAGPGWLGRTDVPFPVANVDEGSPAVVRFTEDVLGEVAALTPGPYLHIGGDEAFGMDDAAHARFATRAAATVRRLGKTVVGWQEASRADVGPCDVLQYWADFAASIQTAGSVPARSGPGGKQRALLLETFRKAAGDLERIASKGAQFIVSPTSHAYLDRPHAEASADPRQETRRPCLGLSLYPPTPLSAYSGWDPVTQMAGVPPRNLLGVEAALWCESIQGIDDLALLLLPRLPGTAEAGWAHGTSAWPQYRSRLAEHGRLWTMAGWDWFRANSVDWQD
jgi:hexosaminidase